MSTPKAKKKVPDCLEDFDNSIVISHPGMSNNRQHVVQHPDFGTGIWSANLKKPILSVDKANNHWVFKPIIPIMSTARIFWLGEYDHRKNLYMAESQHQCAAKVGLPKDYKFTNLLSGNIVLLESDNQPTLPHKYWIYSISTKGIIPLDMNGNSSVQSYSTYVFKNGKQIMLNFQHDNGRGTVRIYIFIVDSIKFAVERAEP